MGVRGVNEESGGEVFGELRRQVQELYERGDNAGGLSLEVAIGDFTMATGCHIHTTGQPILSMLGQYTFWPVSRVRWAEPETHARQDAEAEVIGLSRADSEDKPR